MAASDKADSAFEAWLAAQWSATTVIFENDDEAKPAAATAWIYAETESLDQDEASIGAGPDGELYREEGLLRLYVIVPRGEGTKPGRVLRDQLAALFQRENREVPCTGGRLLCRAVRRTGGLPWEGEAKGNWWAMPLIVEWELDT